MRQGMPLRLPTQRGVTGFVTEQVRVLLAKRDSAGRKVYNQSTLGTAMHLSRGQIHLILNPRPNERMGGVGEKTIVGLLMALEIDRAEFDRRVMAWEDAHPESKRDDAPLPKVTKEELVEEPERYPNRDEAIRLLRNKISKKTIEDVVGVDMHGHDYSVGTWINMLVDRETENRGGMTALSAELQRQDPEANARRAIERTQPRLPTKPKSRRNSQ